jgi:hypothetical protein
MKKILVLLAAPAYLLVLAGFTCTHQSNGTEQGKASFWKKSDSRVTHYLYIDNEEKGILPFLPESLTTPGNVIVQEQGLSLNLKPSSYDIIAKDTSGNILCEGTLFLKRTESSKEIKSSKKNDKCKVEVVYSD